MIAAKHGPWAVPDHRIMDSPKEAQRDFFFEQIKKPGRVADGSTFSS
jgi:hypothetical protein